MARLMAEGRDSPVDGANNKTTQGYLSAIAATLLWSGNFVVASGLGDRIPPVQLSFWRWLVAVVAITPLALRSVVEHRRLIREHLSYLTLTALIGITVFNTLVYLAGRTTSAVNLSLIGMTFPILMLFFARIFYGEAITLTKALGTLITVIGVVVLITGGSLDRLLQLSFAPGDLWMFLAATLFAIYSMLVKRKPEGMPVLAFQFSTFALGLCMLLPLYLWSRATQPTIVWDRATVLGVGYVGVFASMVAFFLWNQALLIVGPSKAALIYYLAPVFSGIAGSLFLGQQVGLLHAVCMVVIVLGMLTASGSWQELRRHG
ncbi:MAG: DMT family transporter [Anaerolineae bacterium]|nr:DMT family transporter [Anaerolineae bacterium]